MARPIKPELYEDADEMAHEAIAALRKFITQAEVTSLDIGRARISASTFSGWTRLRQSETANEGNMLLLARELAEDKAQFRKFIRLGMPNAPILRALPTVRKEKAS